MNVILPTGGAAVSLGGCAVTLTVPCAMYRLKAGSCDSGIPNVTLIGAI